MPSRILFLVVAIAGALGVVSQLLRGTMGVIAPDMMRDLGFGPERLGLLTAIFFLVYAGMQVPMGLLLDRYGPRRVVTTFLCIAIAGTVLFALAEGYAGLVVGRAVMGMGAAALYMGGFNLLVRWVDSERYMRLAATMVTIANVGSLFATSPFAVVAELVGWRGAFLVIAGIAAFIASIMFIAVRDWPPGSGRASTSSETLLDSLKGLLTIIRDRRIQRVCTLALVTYPTIASVFVLWGGPYLHDIHGLDTIDRGNILFLMALAVSIGPLIFSWVEVRLGARRTVLLGCSLHTLSLAGLAVFEAPSLVTVEILFILLGVASGYNLLLPAVSRFFFADNMAARVMTTVTVFIVGGVGLFQSATGFIVGAFTDSAGVPGETAYRLMFGFLAVAMMCGTLVFSRIKDFSIRRRET